MLFCVALSPAQTPPPALSTETAWIEQAQRLIAAGDFTRADALLTDGLAKYPRSGGLYNLVGIAAAERNQNAQAESAFQKAVALAPGLTPAYLNLARIEYAEGKTKGAIAAYERAIQLDSKSEEAHGNLAALLLSERRYADAERHVEALPPAVREQNRFLAIAAAALAGNNRGTAASDTIARLRPPVLESDVSLAALALSRQERSELLIKLVEPTLPNGASPQLRGLLATAYGQTGKLAEARALFDAIGKENPTDSEPLFDAARIAYRQSDFEGSAAYLLSALRSHPESAKLQFFFGIVCIQLKLPGDALRALKEAVRLQPDNPAFEYALGAASLTGEKGNAAAYFARYVQLRPNDPHGKLAFAVAQFDAHDTDSARRELLPLTRDPRVAAGAHYILGKISREEGDDAAAREHFLAALKNDAQNADLEANLAIADIHLNHLDEARRELGRALVLDPENYLANQNLLLVMRREKDPAAEQQAKKFAAITQKVSDEQKLLLRHIDIRSQD